MMRQITFYKFECGTKQMVQADDGRYDLVATPICTVESSSMTKGDIRRAIEDATGAKLARGTEVYARKMGKVVYKFTTEDLMSIVKEREELPLD